MERKEIFEILVKHADKINLSKINTNLIFDGNEKSFLEQAEKLWDKEICNRGIGGIETDYCLFISKEGILFFLSFITWETHPEGPNNEPPGVQDDWNIQWCTKSSEMKTTQNQLNKPYRFFGNWENIKQEVEKSLKDLKIVKFV